MSLRALLVATSTIAVAVAVLVGSKRAWESKVFGREVITLARDGRFESVLTYLRSGGDPNVKDSSGFSLSYYAVTFGNIDVLRALIERGADVRTSPAGFSNPIEEAIDQENLEVLELLISSHDWKNLREEELASYLTRASTHNISFLAQVEVILSKATCR